MTDKEARIILASIELVRLSDLCNETGIELSLRTATDEFVAAVHDYNGEKRKK